MSFIKLWWAKHQKNKVARLNRARHIKITTGNMRAHGTYGV